MKHHPLGGSTMERRKLCPGSYAVESSIEDLPDTEQSKEGSMLHSLAADPSKPRDHLTGDQLDLLESAEQIGNDWYESIRSKHGLGEPKILTEEELWIHDGVTGLLPCHPDWVAVWPSVVAVRDYKFGYLPVTEAESNYQLRTYLVALAEEYEAERWYGAIIQPRVFPKFHSTVYSSGNIQAARGELLDICVGAMQPDAQRRPHPDACRYCKGAITGKCQEARLSPVVLAEHWNHAILPIDQLNQLTPEQRSKLFGMLEVASQIIDTFWAAGRDAMETDPDFIPGYGLQQTPPKCPVNDPTKAWERSQKRGVAIDDFMLATSVNKGTLKEIIRKATGLKGEALDREMAEIFKGITDTNPAKPSLKRL